MVFQLYGMPRPTMYVLVLPCSTYARLLVQRNTCCGLYFHNIEKILCGQVEKRNNLLEPVKPIYLAIVGSHIQERA